MSGTAAETTPNRKQRRSRERRSVKETQLAQLMKRVHDEHKVKRREGEGDEAWFARIRDKAIQIQRYERKRVRTSARTARKRNR